MIFDLWKAFGNFTIARNFAVEDSQWIPFVALVAVGAQLLQVRLNGGLEDFAVLGSTLFATQRVDLEFEIVQSQILEKFNEHRHYFRVNGGTR